MERRYYMALIYYVRDRVDHFKVVELKKSSQYKQTLRSVFRHLSCICAPSGTLENKSQQ